MRKSSVDDLFLLRKKSTYDGKPYFNSGAGTHATPKLYTLAGARAAVKHDITFINRHFKNHEHFNEMLANVWEIVPVTITLGTPLTL